jgi:hypothetical protein
LRWPFLLVGAAVPWVMVRIARREWGDCGRLARWVVRAALPLSGWLGTLALPDAPLVLACLLALDATTALLRRVSFAALAELALALAAGALTHYRFAPAVLAGLLGLLLFAARPRVAAHAGAVRCRSPSACWRGRRCCCGTRRTTAPAWNSSWSSGIRGPCMPAACPGPGAGARVTPACSSSRCSGRRCWQAWRRDRTTVAGAFLGVALVSVSVISCWPSSPTPSG